MNSKMQQAMAAARTGEVQKAQVLLAQILKEDAKNVNAWFLLSHLVEDKDKQRAFLQKVVALQPDHQKALARLAEMEGGVVPVVEPEKVETVVVEETAVSAPPPPEIPTAPAIPPAMPAPAEEEDLLVQADSSSLPSWLTDGDDMLTPEALGTDSLPELSDTVDPEDMPDWLTKTNIDDWTAEKPWEQAEDLFDDLDFDDLDEEDEELREAALFEEELVVQPAEMAAESAPPQPAPTATGQAVTKPKAVAPEKSSDNGWLNRVLMILIAVAAIVLILLLYIVITSL